MAVAAENKKTAVFYTALNIILPLTLLLLSAISLVGDSYNPFIYFQF
jgi:alginate O-acetyltransferase complex protein AlgI